MSVRGELPVGGDIVGTGDRGDVRARGEVGYVRGCSTGEIEFRERRVVDSTEIGIQRPGVQEVLALTTNDVVVSLSAIDAINIVDQPAARSSVAKEHVIATEPVDGVTAKSSVDPVTGAAAQKSVVSRSPIQCSDPVTRPVG